MGVIEKLCTVKLSEETRMKIPVVMLGLASLLMGCSSAKTSSGGLSDPYVASPERQAQIRNGVTRVVEGMTTSQVVASLGQPDEVRPLHEPRIWRPKQIGHTWWFVIRRNAASASAQSKAEELVRVSFNLRNEVTTIESWGINERSDNK